jgi:hypothetical protein
MRVQLLYFEDCPNWRVADRSLAEALSVAGLSSTGVEHVLVHTLDEAERWAFLGSPSIRIDGIDPFADEADGVGLACRIYPTPAGPAGSPTVDQLVAALQAG